MNTLPVLVIAYKRFDFVLRILEQLAICGLKKVYISVDDFYNSTDQFKAIEAFLEHNDFVFRVKKWESNVGCDTNVIEGIHWFFSQENEGIILEDDCVPAPGFGQFARLLETHRHQYNISLFAAADGNTSFFLEPVFLPVFWGWYSSAGYYNGFYEFYHRKHSFWKVAKKVFKTGLSTKIKLIALLNYCAHKAGKKGVAWDSQLFMYQLINNQPFLSPSHSLINNIGFGNLDSTFTHTAQVPDWFPRSSESRQPLIQSIEIKNTGGNNDFLEAFFKDYTNNKLKLSATLLITLAAKKNRRQGTR